MQLKQKACKSAVKAGKKLTENEIIVLLKQREKNNMVLQCPHGRPAAVVLTKTDLEKMFKRII